jgi:hypothetical protein
MEYAAGEGSSWRHDMQEWLESRLGHAVFNPTVESQKFFRDRYPRVDIRQLKFDDLGLYTEILRHLIDIDCREIAERSDYIVCYWDESAARGAGTKGELTMAKFFGKPVYLVTQDRLHDLPGWVLGCVTQPFTSFEALKSFLESRS